MIGEQFLLLIILLTSNLLLLFPLLAISHMITSKRITSLIVYKLSK